MENGRVLIEKESGEASPGSEGLQRLRRARVRTRLSTDEATSLHRLIRDEILGQARQPLPDRGDQGWHRIVATALHLPGGPSGRPRTDRQLFQCGSGKRHHQPWVGLCSAASTEAERAAGPAVAEQTSILSSAPFPGYPISFARQKRSNSVDTLTELATKSKGCKDS